MRSVLFLAATLLFCTLAARAHAQAQGGASSAQQAAAAAAAAQALPNGIQNYDDLKKYEMIRRAMMGRGRGNVVTGDPRLALPQGFGVPPTPPGLPTGKPRGLSRGSGRRNPPVNAEELAEKKKQEKQAALEAKKAAAKK